MKRTAEVQLNLIEFPRHNLTMHACLSCV